MGMNRRSFVKGSALGLAAVAASSAVAANALADETEAATATAEGAPTEVAASPAAPSWLGEEPSIDPASISATYETDILIVGMGCSGSAAAATAAELGLNCICVERGAGVPETREYLAGVNTPFTLESGNETDPGKLLNEISRYASGKCDRDLVKLWIDNSAETIEWVDGILTAAGKEVAIDVPPEHPTGGTDYYLPTVQHCWEPSYTYPMRNDLFAQATQDAGNAVLFNCKLVKLLHDGGAVTGGICAYDGGYIQINAPYTIIATGGYAGNPEMMKALQPDTVRCVSVSSYHSFDDGSGIKAGIWAGAAKESDPTPMIFDRGSILPDQTSGYVVCDDGIERFPGQNYQLNIGSQPFLKVNRRGERFANESTPYDNMLFAAGRQPGGVFCQVFDANAKEDIMRFNTIGCSRQIQQQLAAHEGTLEEFFADKIEEGTIFVADTIEELADKLGFEGEAKETFLAEVDRYNTLYDNQLDEDFGKEAYRLSALRTAPFYGGWFGGSLLTTCDGLRINSEMQVLTPAAEPIEGLYAIGDCSGSYFANNYPEYLIGAALGRTLTQGRHVVRRIAGDIQ